MRIDITDFLQVARVALQLMQSALHPLRTFTVHLGCRLRQHRLRDDQFAHQIDELIDLLDIHADGSIGRSCRGTLSLARRPTRAGSSATSVHSTPGVLLLVSCLRRWRSDLLEETVALPSFLLS